MVIWSGRLNGWYSQVCCGLCALGDLGERMLVWEEQQEMEWESESGRVSSKEKGGGMQKIKSTAEGTRVKLKERTQQSRL